MIRVNCARTVHHLAFGHALYETVIMDVNHPETPAADPIYGMLLPVQLAEDKLDLVKLDAILAQLFSGGIFADVSIKFARHPLAALQVSTAIAAASPLSQAREEGYNP